MNEYIIVESAWDLIFDDGNEFKLTELGLEEVNIYGQGNVSITLVHRVYETELLDKMYKNMTMVRNLILKKIEPDQSVIIYGTENQLEHKLYYNDMQLVKRTDSMDIFTVNGGFNKTTFVFEATPQILNK